MHQHMIDDGIAGSDEAICVTISIRNGISDRATVFHGIIFIVVHRYARL
jgi:hypothetical protein